MYLPLFKLTGCPLRKQLQNNNQMVEECLQAFHIQPPLTLLKVRKVRNVKNECGKFLRNECGEC